MKYEYMKESEQMLQYFQFPKFLLKLRISQTAKFFIFPAKNTLSLIRNAERHFYSPLRKTFLFFLLIKYLKIKKHSPIQVNALSKFSYFVVYDAYSETLAYLLKCNCQQLYFHVGMGT